MKCNGHQVEGQIAVAEYPKTRTKLERWLRRRLALKAWETLVVLPIFGIAFFVWSAVYVSTQSIAGVDLRLDLLSGLGLEFFGAAITFFVLGIGFGITRENEEQEYRRLLLEKIDRLEQSIEELKISLPGRHLAAEQEPDAE